MASRLCSPFLSSSLLLSVLFPALLLLHLPGTAKGDCWLIEGDKGYVWLAICSQNQPPYETIPQHINSTVSVRLSIRPSSMLFIRSQPPLLMCMPSCILSYDRAISKADVIVSHFDKRTVLMNIFAYIMSIQHISDYVSYFYLLSYFFVSSFLHCCSSACLGL